MIEFNEKFWLATAFIILFIASFKSLKLRFKLFAKARSNYIESKLFEAKLVRERASEIAERLKNKERTIDFMLENIANKAKLEASTIIEENNQELELLKSRKLVDLQLKIENYQNQASNLLKEQAIKLSIQTLKDFISENKNLITHLNTLSIKKLMMR